MTAGKILNSVSVFDQTLTFHLSFSNILHVCILNRVLVELMDHKVQRATRSVLLVFVNTLSSHYYCQYIPLTTVTYVKIVL